MEGLRFGKVGSGKFWCLKTIDCFYILVLFQLNPREKDAFKYNEALKQKFSTHPQIKRIARHRQVPRYIYKQQDLLKAAKSKEKKKDANRRLNSKPGSIPYVPDKEKVVIREDE